MGRLKTFRKYILWIVGFYIFSTLLIYIGLNTTYKDINNIESIPECVDVEVAEATKVNGRIYGKITNSEQNNLNGKFLKVQIYNYRNEYVATKYLEIKDTNLNEPKKFAVYFTAENIKGYTIEILEKTEKVEEEKIKAENLFKDIFTNTELKKYAIITLVLYGIFIL